MINLHKPTEKTKMFLDPNGPVGIARYDIPKYPVFEKLTKKQNGYFWGAEEIDCSKDGKDFREFGEFEQHMFTSNIYRQILLDSKQGRAPSAILAPIASLPEVDAWIQTWNYFETIHSRSYTHIIQNVFSDPTKVLDQVMSIEPIMACAESISAPYDEVERWNTLLQIRDNSSWYKRFITWTREGSYDAYEHKKALWMALNSINALEGIRFYVSFACSWAFAELKKMEGNAKIIKFIARDENLHLAGTQHMLKLLPREDPDFAKIQQEMLAEIQTMFEDVVTQEVQWAEYLFKNGSMIGLNAKLLTDYVHWIANKRMRAVGLEAVYDVGGSNPLPWTEKWISGADVQVAPQEVEISSYVVAGTKRDLDSSAMAGFEL